MSTDTQQPIDNGLANGCVDWDRTLSCLDRPERTVAQSQGADPLVAAPCGLTTASLNGDCKLRVETSMTIALGQLTEAPVSSHTLRTALFSPPLRSSSGDRRHGSRGRARGRRLLDQLHGTFADTIGAVASKVGVALQSQSLPLMSDRLTFIEENMEHLEWFHDRLSDEYSRRMLVGLLRSRIFVTESSIQQSHHDKYEESQIMIRRKLLVERNTRRPWLPYLNRYCFNGASGKIVIQTEESNVLNTFLLERCAYVHDDVVVRARPGDIVIEAGSGWGDTAMYFADLVGELGHVYALPANGSHAAIIGENLILNPRLRDLVSIHEGALIDGTHSRTDIPFYGLSITDTRMRPHEALRALSIDDLVAQHALHRVDFIRLDVDGAEYEMLVGAHNTIRSYRPTLAVSLCHREQDIVTIPAYLDTVAEDFDFFLDDVTIGGEGVVLFACPRSPASIT